MVIKKKKGQIWVETVIYTLIGLVLIGLILAFANPVIQKQKDKVIIESSIESMIALDNAILEVKKSTGNIREVNFLIRKGTLMVDGEDNKLTFTIEDSDLQFIKLDSTIDYTSNLRIKTLENSRNYDVILILDYSEDSIYDLRYNYKAPISPSIIPENDGIETKIFTMAQTPYRLMVENIGRGPTPPVTVPPTPNPIRINIYDAS